MYIITAIFENCEQDIGEAISKEEALQVCESHYNTIEQAESYLVTEKGYKVFAISF
ncbi:hypothetical protein BCB4_0067 [Bacillus phage B4]|uniref:Uncharacterized protein n=2 Tax=Bequatrovirus B4 TaxID=1918005 RepID=J9PRS2_9CAUD|nr:hypothetical protein BCB4_0067 [Bacillus phage B4]YP_009783662.1 hypothetical protein QLX26_gp066 [Bacillus phage B5S]MEB9013921.1 hypothetical protein [Bacillus cereus]AEW47300.1 hypothetical protein B5S_0066 [Bacillus phage B5S]AEZ65860.1 hypothetical protein BCB4_0067 [Bacillus phage B4]MEB9190466.1 hypothetical protein [Bacillus cereus]